MQRFFAAASFSFLIIAGLLAWEAYKGATGQLGPIGGGRISLFLVGALLSFVMGIFGIRARHRRLAQLDDEWHRMNRATNDLRAGGPGEGDGAKGGR